MFLVRIFQFAFFIQDFFSQLTLVLLGGRPNSNFLFLRMRAFLPPVARLLWKLSRLIPKILIQLLIIAQTIFNSEVHLIVFHVVST